MIDYVNELRENCLEAYTGIVQGLKGENGSQCAFLTFACSFSKLKLSSVCVCFYNVNLLCCLLNRHYIYYYTTVALYLYYYTTVTLYIITIQLSHCTYITIQLSHCTYITIQLSHCTLLL